MLCVHHSDILEISIGYPLFTLYTYFKMMKLYMFAPVSGMYSCPLAMTDGATRTIEVRIIPIIVLKLLLIT